MSDAANDWNIGSPSPHTHLRALLQPSSGSGSNDTSMTTDDESSGAMSGRMQRPPFERSKTGDSFEDAEDKPRLRANYSRKNSPSSGSAVSFELSPSIMTTQNQQQQSNENAKPAASLASFHAARLRNRSLSLQQHDPNGTSSAAAAPAKSLLHHTQSLGLAGHLQAAERKASLSFSAVGFMVESMHRLHSKIADKSHDVEKAVLAEDMGTLRTLCTQDEAALSVAAFTAVREDKADMILRILRLCQEHNLTGQESSFQDSDGDGLLHAAVRAASSKCCEFLLQQGFCPNRWNAGGSATAMHHAASEGRLELLRLLKESGRGCLEAGVERDGQSVLHAAVRGNRPAVVRYLLAENVDRTGRGKFTETPLHVASENNFWECAGLLLEAGTLVDALRGERSRETALHVAAFNGYAETASLLLRHGADPNARNGQLETPLHLAAKSLCAGVMRDLIANGADVDACDHEGRPPLHFAINSNQKGSTECMQVLIDKGANLNQTDNNGLTALHLAALNRKLSRVKVLIRNGADLCIRNNSGKSALSFVMKYAPNSLRTIEERMDAGIQLEQLENEVASKVKMNFNLLIPSRRSQSLYISEVGLFTEMLQLHNNEAARLEKILMHPLALSFLHLKWQQVKWLYYVIILFSHFIYSLTYSVYSVLLYNTLCKPDDWPADGVSFFERLGVSAECDFAAPAKAWAVRPMIVAWIFLILFNILYVSREATKLAHLRGGYFREWESVLNLLTIISFPLISLHSSPFRPEQPVTVAGWQFHAAGIGVFITWVLQLFLMGKVPKFGKYVQMLMNVGWSFFNFFVAYSSLLLGFALSFVILFPREVSFQEALAAPIKVMVMMTGEIEYNDLYYPQRYYIAFNRSSLANASSDDDIVKGYIEEEDLAQNFPFTAHIVLAIFIIIVSIVIMNLLFGMAVSDVQELYKKSRLHQSIQQVHLISYMESILFSPMFIRMPACVQKFLRRKLLGLEGRYRNICEIEPDSYEDKKLLPHHLNKSIKDKCVELYRRRDDQPTLRGLTVSVARLEHQVKTLTEALTKRLELSEAGSEPTTSTKNLSHSIESQLCDEDQDFCSMDLPDSTTSSPSKSMLKRESQLSMASSIISAGTLAKIPEDDDSI